MPCRQLSYRDQALSSLTVCGIELRQVRGAGDYECDNCPKAERPFNCRAIDNVTYAADNTLSSTNPVTQVRCRAAWPAVAGAACSGCCHDICVKLRACLMCTRAGPRRVPTSFIHIWVDVVCSILGCFNCLYDARKASWFSPSSPTLSAMLPETLFYIYIKPPLYSPARR